MVNVRQSDIAKKLGVSRVTVSKALRNHPDISTAMKKKVIAMADKMGYVPNLIATQLNSRKTNTIGIVVPDLENSFFSYVVDSMIDYATENNYRVILTVSREKESVEKQNIENLIGIRVDGLLLCNSQETKDTSILSLIKKMKIPLVFFDRVVKNAGFPSVVFNDREGALLSLTQVIGSGYSKIAHFAGYQGINIGKERLEGYKASLEQNGIPVRKEWILEGGYELIDGQNAFKKLLSLEELPEIVFAVNDRVALGAYLAAKEAGLVIPSEIGIMGFGFSETTNLFSPPLAVINQDPRKMGRVSAQKLIDEINTGKRTKPLKIKIEEEFYWRESLKKVELRLSSA
ncbi:MAG TPA: LacI family DNA-binding transcriptional regulator [Bacteroidales bacterium]|nr:LacI family DNA-binding transcriptional regulator [Bacteroidales bacterium]